MMRRFSSITLTAMVRCEVASGMATLAAIFSAMRAGAPRKGISSSEPESSGSAAGRTITAAADGEAGTAPLLLPVRTEVPFDPLWSNTDFHSGSTDVRSR